MHIHFGLAVIYNGSLEGLMLGDVEEGKTAQSSVMRKVQIRHRGMQMGV